MLHSVILFKKILDESSHIAKSNRRKPDKICVDKDSEFCSRSVKSWLQGKDIEMYSTHNEGKSVIAERFISTLRNKIYKHKTAISKNVYIDRLDNTVDKYYSMYHKRIKMKPIDVKTRTYIDFDVKNNDKYPKFKVGDYALISKYQNIFGLLFLGEKGCDGFTTVSMSVCQHVSMSVYK